MRLQRNSKTPRFIIWVVISQSDGFQSLSGASLDEDFAGVCAGGCRAYVSYLVLGVQILNSWAAGIVYL